MSRIDEAERIIARCRERRDAGEVVDSDAVIRSNPRLAAELRAGFAAQARLDRALGGPRGDDLTSASLGPYRVTSRLGSGGMGDVYLAADAERRVAIKVLRPHLLERPGFLDRFRREAEVGTRIRHENVVRTLDAADFDVRGARRHCLVMEYVEGQTLRAMLAELDRLPEDLCRHVGREIAKGLAAIHAAGVVHRDLKPDNVIVTRDHVVKVMDLGVALLVDEAARLSQTGAFVGSIHYAAPEQFRKGGRVLDARADLHALGVVLYELATGSHPYPDEDFHEVMRRLLTEKPRRAAEINPQLSPFFEEVVHKLLAKDPDDRFASADELASVLADGEQSAWWHARARSLRLSTKRPLRRIRIPRETALYGRDAELAKLRALFERAKSGEGQVLLLEGEAGIGKSRLVDEFVGRLQQSGEDVNFLFGSYPPGGAATASGAFTTAYREHFGEESLEETLRGYLKVTPILVPAFAALLRGDGTPEGAEPLTKDSLQTVFVHATRALAAERTTIVLIEDLHFAPEEGRALFASLAMAVPGQRVLVVGTTRPGLDENWLTSLDRLEQTSRMPLPRLGAKDLARLLVDAFHSERLAEELSFKIAAKSDGNPYFVFEILRGLRDGQFIARQPDGTWVTTRIIAEIEVPSTVKDLIFARMGNLPTEERNLLDVAACAGFEFDPVLVGGVVGLGPIPALQRLAGIEKSHRLVRSAGRRFVFDHHQVAEVLYAAIPEVLREHYHASIAASLETQHGGASKEPKDVDGALCVELAEHFLKGAQGARALRYLDPALTHLERGYLNDAAVRLTERALAVSGLLAGKQRLEILVRRAGRLDLLGRREAERAALNEAQALSDALGDPALRALALVALGRHFNAVSRYSEAESSNLSALELARAAGDKNAEADATGNLGIVFRALRRLAEARELQERALALFRESGNRRGEANSIGNLASVFASIGGWAEAREHHERHLALARETGNRKAEAIATVNLGFSLIALGEPALARRRFEESLALCREIGARYPEGYALRGLADVADEEGDAGTALRLAEESLELRGQIGHGEGVASSLLQVAELRGRTGETASARSALEKSLRLSREQGRAAQAAHALAMLACLPGGDARAAFDALAAAGPDSDPAGVRWLLWQATGEQAHLVAAKRLLDEALAKVPAEYHAAMLTNVRLNREIAATAKEHGL